MRRNKFHVTFFSLCAWVDLRAKFVLATISWRASADHTSKEPCLECFTIGSGPQTSQLMVNFSDASNQVETWTESVSPRCVYSSQKLAIFTPSSELMDTIVVRQNISCVNPVETQYYSATLVAFLPVCYYCGVNEDALIKDDEMKRLRCEYAVVRPLCFLCKSDGKTPFVKMPRNSRKRPRPQAVSKNLNHCQLYFCFVTHRCSIIIIVIFYFVLLTVAVMLFLMNKF